MNREFPGRDLHPLVTCALVAHQNLVALLWQAPSKNNASKHKKGKPTTKAS
jgi:hypothetical protein